VQHDQRQRQEKHAAQNITQDECPGHAGRAGGEEEAGSSENEEAAIDVEDRVALLAVVDKPPESHQLQYRGQQEAGCQEQAEAESLGFGRQQGTPQRLGEPAPDSPRNRRYRQR